MDSWSIVHTYEKLVNSDLANPLPCPGCGERMIPRLDKEAEPRYWCGVDSTYVKIGLRTLDLMRQQIANAHGEDRRTG